VTEKEDRYNQLYMDIAERFAQMSHAVRAKVGAVLIRDGNVISFGWNGTPKGTTNRCELDIIENGVLTTVTASNVQHAEENLLMKLLQSGISSKDSTLYVTLLPCHQCSKLIYGAGIKNVYYRDSYRDSSGARFLESLDIKIERLT
jgi:dCMP deaminase